MGVTNFDVVKANSYLGLPATQSNGAAASGAGQTFYVNNSTAILPGAIDGSDNNSGKSWMEPFDTIAKAVSLCVANRGDVIYVGPNHSETYTAAAALALSVAGIQVLGVGVGDNRPRLTFSTSTAASITISGNGVSFKNFICIAGIDGLTNPINITGDGGDVDVEWRDGSSSVEAARAILCTGVDRAKIRLKYLGFTAGDACVNAVRLVNCTDIDIVIDTYGKCSTAWVEMLTTASSDINVRGITYTSGTTNGSRNVVDTVTGSTYTVDLFDASAGVLYSGNANTGLINQDASAITEVLAGSSGVGVFPAAAPAANNVSIAEVLRYVQDQVASDMLNRNASNYLSVTADFTSATWNTAAAHEIATVTGGVHLIIIPQITKSITSAGGAATLILGDETTTNSIIASTDAENLAAGEVWVDATDTRTLAAKSNFDKTNVVVFGGKDIGYTIGTEALTDGSIVFHMWWVPITADGNVAAGAGGAL